MKIKMKIEAYSFGNMVVEGKRYTSDLIIFPERIEPSWWRKEGHLLHMEDLKEVLEEGPDVLIIGTGHNGVMKVPESLIMELQNKGITVYVEKTKKSVDIYNNLVDEQKVIAAFHLTC